MTRPLMPTHIASIHPYVPGKPIEEVEREYGIRDSVKLASNENPMGPSPRALNAIREALPTLHFYPQGDGYYLRHAIARKVGIDPEWVILGNGSTEIIEMSAKALLGRDDNAVIGRQAFIMYQIAVQAVNGNFRSVPFRGDTHDLPAMAAAIDSATKLVYLANPNNPTGTYNTAPEIDDFLARVPEDVTVVIDEAYFEYVDRPDYPDTVSLLRAGRGNLLVLRTFSKAHGLAGLRIGYGMGHPRLMEALHRVRSPFNTSNLAQAGALAALEDHEHLERSRQMNRVELAFLQGEIARRGFRVTPSIANFLLVDVEMDCNEFFVKLIRQGVIVRPMKGYNFPTSVRVSIGTRQENERFLHALDALGLK